jgi:hypothetical protein
LKAIPKLLDIDGNPNYLPLIRSMAALHELGIGDGLTSLNLGTISKISNDFKGVWSSYSKQRKVSDIPIELDPFNAISQYIATGYKEVHLSPVAALAKKMATAKLKIPGEKYKASMLEHNPALGRFLVNWSDQILGKDPVATALMAKNDWMGRALSGPDSVAAKLVAAIIGGSVRTVLVQPSAYMTSTFSNFGNPYYAAYGISKLLSDIGKESRYKRESSIAPLREVAPDMLDITEYMQRGLISGWRRKATDISLAPMSWMDKLVAEATWNASIKYAEGKLKLKGEHARKLADEFVEKSQGLAHKGAVSPMEASAATKWMTTLQSFGIAEFNFIARNILGIKNPSVRSKDTVGRVVRYLGAMVLTSYLYKMIGLENVVPDPIGEYE